MGKRLGKELTCIYDHCQYKICLWDINSTKTPFQQNNSSDETEKDNPASSSRDPNTSFFSLYCFLTMIKSMDDIFYQYTLHALYSIFIFIFIRIKQKGRKRKQKTMVVQSDPDSVI